MRRDRLVFRTINRDIGHHKILPVVMCVQESLHKYPKEQRNTLYHNQWRVRKDFKLPFTVIENTFKTDGKLRSRLEQTINYVLSARSQNMNNQLSPFSLCPNFFNESFYLARLHRPRELKLITVLWWAWNFLQFQYVRTRHPLMQNHFTECYLSSRILLPP